MNARNQKMCFRREGLKTDNTIIMDVYITGIVIRIRPLSDDDLPKFKHITNAAFVEIEDFENDYAKMFAFHNMNIVAFNSRFKTILLYKTDGTIVEYGE